MDRRQFMANAGAGLTLAIAPGSALAQAHRGYGSPAGTWPFAPEVYAARRKALMAKMGGGVGVVMGAKSMTSGAVADLPQQTPDFAYLTGIQDEVGAALVLAPDERTYKEFLLLAGRDIETERWEGERLPLGEAIERRTGFARIYRTNSLGGLATSLASRSPALHHLGPVVAPSAPVPEALAMYGQIAGRVPGASVKNSSTLIRDMRVAKEAREIELIRKAIAATEAGLRAAMKAVRPGMTERQLKAILEAEFIRAGADGLAFPSIVATGRASAVLHYTGGDGVIQDGDLVLCDVGASVGGYAADITRTFPASGRFSPEQRQIYDTVLAAQEAGVKALRNGAVYEDVDKASRDTIKAAGHGDDFWHGLGHFIGLEVHDVGSTLEPLPENATITIEPGIYQPDRGFGVRIEDDYRVTATGSEHLSSGTPRRPADIEAAVGT